MQFKHKLIYFALGCAFVVIGQVLLSVVVPKVTAQGKKASAEFDTVTCRSLKVVDAKGKIRAQLEVDIIGIDVIQILNPAGIPVCKIGSAIGGGGSVIVAGDNGIARAGMLVWANGTGGLNVMNKYGVFSVGIGANENTNNGYIEIFGNNFKLQSKIWSDANGGRADFCNNNVETRAAIGVNEYGNGVVSAWDRNGNLFGSLQRVPSNIGVPSTPTTRFPSSTPQRKRTPSLTEEKSNNIFRGSILQGKGKYSGGTGGHWVSKVLESGKYVILEDKSLWEVSPLDRINSMLWLITEDIIVVKNTDGVYVMQYPYKLINSDSKNAVEAKYLGISE